MLVIVMKWVRPNYVLMPKPTTFEKAKKQKSKKRKKKKKSRNKEIIIK